MCEMKIRNWDMLEAQNVAKEARPGGISSRWLRWNKTRRRRSSTLSTHNSQPPFPILNVQGDELWNIAVWVVPSTRWSVTCLQEREREIQGLIEHISFQTLLLIEEILHSLRERIICKVWSISSDAFFCTSTHAHNELNTFDRGDRIKAGRFDLMKLVPIIWQSHLLSDCCHSKFCINHRTKHGLHPSWTTIMVASLLAMLLRFGPQVSNTYREMADASALSWILRTFVAFLFEILKFWAEVVYDHFQCYPHFILWYQRK